MADAELLKTRGRATAKTNVQAISISKCFGVNDFFLMFTNHLFSCEFNLWTFVIICQYFLGNHLHNKVFRLGFADSVRVRADRISCFFALNWVIINKPVELIIIIA